MYVQQNIYQLTENGSKRERSTDAFLRMQFGQLQPPRPRAAGRWSRHVRTSYHSSRGLSAVTAAACCC